MNHLHHYLLICLFFIPYLTTNASAVVYEYSVNKKDGLIVLDLDQTGHMKKIRTFSKSPYDSELQHIRFLGEMFHSSAKEFSIQKEITVKPALGLTTVKTLHDKGLWEISFHERYSKVLYFVGDEIKNRFLLDPKLPVYDFLELFFFLSDKSKQPMYDFYILEKGTPVRMSLKKENSDKYLLTINNKCIANVYFNSEGVIKKIDFSKESDETLGHYSLELRNVKENVGEFGPVQVLVNPDIIKKVLERSDQWNKNYKRFFEETNGSLRYVTSKTDTYNIAESVQKIMKDRLVKAGVITGDNGYSNMNIQYDNNDRVFSASINEQCKLQYENNHASIIEMQQNIKRSKSEVRFQPTIDWSLKKDKYLIASFTYEYMHDKKGKKTYSIGTELNKKFKKEFGRIPDRYNYTIKGDKINVIGMKKRSLWWDKTIGTIALEQSRYWEDLSQKFKQGRKRITKKISCKLHSYRNNEVIELTFNFREKKYCSENISFNLSKEFCEKYGIEPKIFLMDEDSGAITIKGSLSESQQGTKVTFSELKKTINEKLPSASNYVKEEWEIIKKHEKYYIAVKRHLNIPIDKNKLEGVINKDYDIMEGLKCHLVNPREIKCSFWGFEKQR